MFRGSHGSGIKKKQISAKGPLCSCDCCSVALRRPEERKDNIQSFLPPKKNNDTHDTLISAILHLKSLPKTCPPEKRKNWRWFLQTFFFFLSLKDLVKLTWGDDPICSSIFMGCSDGVVILRFLVIGEGVASLTGV